MFSDKVAYFLTVVLSFLFINKYLVYIIYVKETIYLLFYNLHDCIFKITPINSIILAKLDHVS